jgi:hypothetical protein
MNQCLERPARGRAQYAKVCTLFTAFLQVRAVIFRAAFRNLASMAKTNLLDRSAENAVIFRKNELNF